MSFQPSSPFVRIDTGRIGVRATVPPWSEILPGRRHAERFEQMSVPIRAGQDEILRRRDPLAPRECVELRGVEAVGGREIKRVERLDLRESRLAQPLADDRCARCRRGRRTS